MLLCSATEPGSQPHVTLPSDIMGRKVTGVVCSRVGLCLKVDSIKVDGIDGEFSAVLFDPECAARPPPH